MSFQGQHPTMDDRGCIVGSHYPYRFFWRMISLISLILYIQIKQSWEIIKSFLLLTFLLLLLDNEKGIRQKSGRILQSFAGFKLTQLLWMEDGSLDHAEWAINLLFGKLLSDFIQLIEVVILFVYSFVLLQDMRERLLLCFCPRSLFVKQR